MQNSKRANTVSLPWYRPGNKKLSSCKAKGIKTTHSRIFVGKIRIYTERENMNHPEFQLLATCRPKVLWAEQHLAIFSAVKGPVGTFNIAVGQNYRIAIIQGSGLGPNQSMIGGAWWVLNKQAGLGTTEEHRKTKVLPTHNEPSRHNPTHGNMETGTKQSANGKWITQDKIIFVEKSDKTKVSIVRMMASINEGITILKEKLYKQNRHTLTPKTMENIQNIGNKRTSSLKFKTQ